eukprot:280772_1
MQPTTDPSTDPTTEPTNDPSVDPTNYPTNNPTIDPTMQPTDEPTNNPTIDPSMDPTSEPTFNPTFSPSVTPTNAPTYSPISSPTNAPTNSPTKTPTAAPLEVAELLAINFDDKSRNFDTIFYIVLVTIPFVLTVGGLILSLDKMPNAITSKLLLTDNTNYIGVILYFIQIFDMYSDGIFTIQLYQYYMFSISNNDINNETTNIFYTLFLSTMMFILIPYALNFGSSIRIISEITNSSVINEYTKNYFKENGKLYSVAVLLSGGSFYTLKLINSNWIGIKQFQCGLSTIQIDAFSTHKILFTTILENVPQLVIQLYFIVKLKLITTTVVIASLSSVFNILLSVMSAIISRITHNNQKEYPFTINLSWKQKYNKNTIKNDGDNHKDPYSKVGKRNKLSQELNNLNTNNDPFDFEILSSNKTSNVASIHGVLKIDESCTKKEEKIKAYFEKSSVLNAVMTAFEYIPEYTNLYDFDINISRGAAKEIYLSEEAQKYLPQILRYVNWDEVREGNKVIDDKIISRMTKELNRLHDNVELEECKEVDISIDDKHDIKETDLCDMSGISTEHYVATNGGAKTQGIVNDNDVPTEITLLEISENELDEMMDVLHAIDD